LKRANYNGEIKRGSLPRKL